ncbi:hypothetical protein [Staphylococcus sp. 17KM0847]|uniref:hypothetical protein n=1 Tax=Staphylococcus sp. 17KM0847 TaxID=2583989 RepID=UPI0015DC20E9|nr:hypothetical protein [Staphylococcus sp. 17KM0847]QLK85412.1 hypothetical protein FGL66_01200 [Staphylococcus sp. 17KM0847]
MNMTKKISLSFIALLFLIALLFVTYFFFRNNTPSSPATIQADLTFPYKTTGIVQSDYSYFVTYEPKYGYVQEIHVKEGQVVTPETPLLTYYNPLKIPEINALSTLISRPLSSQQAHKLTYELLKLKSQLYTTIETPVFGIVRLHEIVPSKKDSIVLEIQSKTQCIITRIPTDMYSKLQKQRTVTIINNSSKESVKGHIKVLFHRPLDPISNNYSPRHFARIKTTKKYPIGTSLTVYLGHPQMILPADILFDKNSIIIQKNKKYVKRIINYDRINEQLIIKSGIFVGEKVVRNPNKTVLKTN